MFFGYHRLEEINKTQIPSIEIVVKDSSELSDLSDKKPIEKTNSSNKEPSKVLNSSSKESKKSLKTSSPSDEEDKYVRLPGGRIFALKKVEFMHLDRWRLQPKE